jgi:amino acid permease
MSEVTVDGANVSVTSDPRIQIEMASDVPSAGAPTVIDYDDPMTKSYSCTVCLHWKDLPHFKYRRMMHQFFAQKHFYHPKWLPRGSFIAAAANMCSCTIGVGTLSIPFAIRSAGVITFAVLSAGTFLLTIFSIFLLCRCVDATQLHSFEMMTRSVFQSHRLEVLVEMFMIINCFGAAMAYIVVIGDIAQGFGSIFFPSLRTESGRVLVQSLMFFFLMLPLSLLRTMDRLKFASFFGIFAVSFLIGFVGVSALDHGWLSSLVPVVMGDAGGVMSALPLIFFAFSNQVNAIEIYSEMTSRTPWNFAKICFWSVGAVYMAYCVVGFGGLAIYGYATEGNILNNFSRDAMTAFATAAFVGIFLKVILTFPMNVFPAREALLHLSGEQEVRTCSTKKFVLSTAVVAGGAFIVAIFVPTVNVLFGLVGALCASLFGFILPAVLAYKIDSVWSAKDISPFFLVIVRGLSIFMISLGSFCAVVGTYYSIPS